MVKHHEYRDSEDTAEFYHHCIAEETLKVKQNISYIIIDSLINPDTDPI